MSLTDPVPQPILAWKFENNNVDGLTPSLITKGSYAAPNGGTITYLNSGKRNHTFSEAGTTTTITFLVPVTVEILVVAGGGGGGGGKDFSPGGGGGAGEVYYNPSYSIPAGTYTVTVGAGGVGGVYSTGTNSTNGSDTTFGSITVAGGGRGGINGINSTGGNGGSGGGSARNNVGGSSVKTGGGQGNAGGSSTGVAGAGGGGAGSAGANQTNTNTGTATGSLGGSGVSYSISGSSISYGNGGKGGDRTNSTNGTNSTANTGNGGGGGGANATGSSSLGGNGGSGIVIISYNDALYPTPTYVPGVYGQAINFNNTLSAVGESPNCYVVYDVSSFNLVANSAALSVWLNSGLTYPIATGNPFYINLQGGSYNGLLTESTATSNIAFQIQKSGSPATTVGSLTAQSGVWTHHCAVFSNVGASSSNTITSYYVNGTFIGTANNDIQQFTTLFLGCQTETSNGALCSIDDVRLYNTDLTAAQVQTIYNARGIQNAGQYKSTPYGTGGTITTSGGNRIHTYTVVGSTTFTCTSSGYVQLLVVAGGGGGGANAGSYKAGGGGGAGEYYYSSAYFITPGTYTVTVGAGGTGGITPSGDGGDGGVSVFGSISANGGGGGSGGSGSNPGRPGGSGGGAGCNGSVTLLGGASVTTAGGLGNKGGDDTSGSNYGGGGGGGSGSVGGDAYATGIQKPGGGIGTESYISGSAVTYASGGAGGTLNGTYTPSAGTNGLGDGGDGAPSGGTVGTLLQNGAVGGSGIVIIAYPDITPASSQTYMTGTPLFSQLSAAVTSSAVGAFSLRAVNGQSTGGGTAKTVQVRPEGQFPPNPFTAPSGTSLIWTQTITGYPFGGSGTYVTNASSELSGTTRSWRAFDGNIGTNGTRWVSAATYVANTPYSGTASTTAGGVSYPGEWLQIQLPQAIVLSSYSIYPQSTNIPATWNVFASNDGTTWTVIDQRGTTPTQGQFNNYTISGSPASYSYYRMGCYQISLNTSFAIVEMQLFGSNVSWNTDFYADRLGNLLTAPVTGTTLKNWLRGATGYVTTWYDQSGAGNHATQATAANQPVIQRATKGPGYMCLYSGTQGLNFGAYNLLNNTNYTTCGVVRRTASTATNYYLCGDGGVNAQDQKFHSGYRTSTQLTLAHYSDDANLTVPTFLTSSTEPTAYNYMMVGTGLSGFLYSYSSGILYSTPRTYTGYLNQAVGSSFSIGGGYGNFTGEIYELIIFTTSLNDLDGTTTINQIYQNQLAYTGT